jgi:FtsP/CotA-like multicopper oxidase with cupredoxin domain
MPLQSFTRRCRVLKCTWLRVVATGIWLFILATFVTIGGGESSDAQGTSEFPQPKTYRSSNGILLTSLQAFIAHNRLQDPSTGAIRDVLTPAYNGAIPGPTWRVKPGDTMNVILLNSLPQNPEQDRTGGFPHDPYTTNLHTHGLTVSPRGIGDNVLREMAPATRNWLRVKIPAEHQSGTFWYHPHKHGAVSFQFFGGMAGFLIVEGGPGTLDEVPEVKAAKDLVMAFQVIRTDATGQVPFVNTTALQLGTDGENLGLWSTYTGSNFYFTTNGVTNPTLSMRPGEVQRWRLLNAAAGETLVVALQGHSLNIIANDGITVPQMRTLDPGVPYVMGAGQRADLLVQAGQPGIYLLQALNPAPSDAPGWSVVSGSGIDPAPRNARLSGDFPAPTYPVTLATIIVSGKTRDMPLPAGPLPVPLGVPSIETMLSTPPNVVRQVAFENCGQRVGMQDPTARLPSCGWYYERYDAAYWGGTDFTTLLMLRDADDTGEPNSVPDPEEPLVNFQKEGLFTHGQPLFADMIVGNYEEWTVENRSFSDHAFHIHQNPILITHINGKPLPTPEWHDTLLVPAAQPQGGDITKATFGSITFRTFYDQVTIGDFVMHCHMLTHEDIGMMQQLAIVPPGGSQSRSPQPHRDLRY